MGEAQWARVDSYVTELFDLLDPKLASVATRSREADLPAIQVSAAEGKLLEILVRVRGARRVLEIGTLGGFSTAFLARGLPAGGHVISLELDPRHAALARASLEAIGLADRVDVVEGDAHDTLARMIAEETEPFDFIFLDAEKSGYPRYWDVLRRLSRPGTLLVADNVVRRGQVVDPDSLDPHIQGVREFNALVAAEAEADATVLQTVGAKGYDGLLVAVIGVAG